MERRQVYYLGRVQGVGFRYTARDIAARHPVTGYVQNLADGRVRLVVEGTPAAIDTYLQAVSDELERFITSAIEEHQPATGEFHAFDIRF